MSEVLLLLLLLQCSSVWLSECDADILFTFTHIHICVPACVFVFGSVSEERKCSIAEEISSFLVRSLKVPWHRTLGSLSLTSTSSTHPLFIKLVEDAFIEELSAFPLFLIPSPHIRWGFSFLFSIRIQSHRSAPPALITFRPVSQCVSFSSQSSLSSVHE